MKKLLYCAAALAMAIFAGSCQQEKLEPVAGNGTVTFTVEAPANVQTRAIADGLNVNELVYEVWLTNELGELTQNAQKLYQATTTMAEENGVNKASITLDLVNDQKFTVLFWAQVQGTDVYNTQELTAVHYKSTAAKAYAANDERLAAFYAVAYVNDCRHVKKDGTPTGSEVKLRRPFAQLNLGTLNTSTAYNVALVSSKVKVTNANTEFNVATSVASEPKVIEFLEYKVPEDPSTLEVNGVDYEYAGMNYLFAGDNATVEYDITTKITGVGGSEMSGNVNNIVSSVPLKENFRTNIIGNLLTSKVDYQIVVDADFNTPDEEVRITEVTNDTEFEAALKQDLDHIVINLGTDYIETRSATPATYSAKVNATGDQYLFGTAKTESITINANGNIINFEHTNGDYNYIRLANPNAKLIINDAILTNSGRNNGPWNRHDIGFRHAVELNNVTSDKAIALLGPAKLTNVAISDVHSSNSEAYGLWITPLGQTVELDNVTITPSANKKGDRAIKIADEYYEDQVAATTLNVKNSTFVSQKKGAVLVTAKVAITINWGEGNNIEGVAADPINAVWVDQANASYADLVTVNGATKVVEGDMKSVLVYTAEELQAAIDNAGAGLNEIGFAADITGNVAIPQNNKSNFIINGLGKKYDGTITVNASSDITGISPIVIRDVNFKTTANEIDFISSVKDNHYPHITVSNCTFEGIGAESNVLPVRIKSAMNFVMENCTATKVHSLIQNTSGWNITIRNCEVTESGRGMALGTVQGATIENVKIDALATKYGIRMDAQYNNNATIKDCQISAFIPVVVRKAEVNSALVFNGTNTMTPANTDGLWCAIGTSEYEANGTMPTPAAGQVTVTLNDAGLDPNGVYGAFKPVAKIGETTYGSFYEAVKVAKNGDTITLLEDAELYFTDEPMYNNIYASVIELNNKTLTIKDGDLRFATTTIKNGNIVVEPKNYPGTAVLLMYGENSLTIENTKITATGISGTYLIGLEGESNLNLINSEILINNSSLVNLTAAIACNGTGSTTIENSNIDVKNINGRACLGGNYSLVNSVFTADYVKAGFFIRANQKLSIGATSTVTITNLVDGKINGIDLYGNAEYNVADGATVNATVGRN